MSRYALFDRFCRFVAASNPSAAADPLQALEEAGLHDVTSGEIEQMLPHLHGLDAVQREILALVRETIDSRERHGLRRKDLLMRDIEAHVVPRDPRVPTASAGLQRAIQAAEAAARIRASRSWCRDS